MRIVLSLGSLSFNFNMSANTVETDATNESQSDIPEWLNATFLEEHLRSHYKNNEIEVTKFEAHPTGGRGENFASSLYRVEVTFNTAKSGSTAENSVSGRQNVIFS